MVKCAKSGRVLFFDLEYYVPESDRKKNGLICFNPYKPQHLLMGGVFCCLDTDKIPESDEELKNQMVSHWDWKNGDEQKQIVIHFSELLSTELEGFKKSGSYNHESNVVLCGIGIVNSDIPAMHDLFRLHKVQKVGQIFPFQNRFRVLDLSIMGASVFNGSKSFLYPLNKKELMKAFGLTADMAKATEVWEMYDQQKFTAIEQRSIDEVILSVRMYQKFTELSRGESYGGK
jgi:hypothetical protein